MDQLDNHDHSRFLTRTNKKAGTLKDCGSRAAEKGTDQGLLIAAAAVQVTWPGSPCIYYGDEAGLCGWTDPDSRRPFPWGRENTKILDIYTYLCRMSRDPVLRLGSWIELYAAHDALAFGRFYRGRGTVTAVNIGPERLLMKLELWRLGCPESAQVRRVLEAGEGVYNVGRLKRAAPGGILELHLKPGSVQILTVG